MEELWRDIPGYEGRYAVSDHGRVKSHSRWIAHHNKDGKVWQRKTRERILRGARRGKYWGVFLGAGDGHYIHHLVLEAFIGPRPSGMESCHNDGDPSNNSLSNLRWDTRSNNMNDMREHGTAPSGERNPMSKLCASDVILIREKAKDLSGRELAARWGVSPMTISRILNRQTWRDV